MRLNDIAYWYYMGLAVQVIYVVIMAFLRRTGDDETRLQKMRAFADDNEMPMSVMYVLLACYCLFWPILFGRKILALCGFIKKKER